MDLDALTLTHKERGKRVSSLKTVFKKVKVRKPKKKVVYIFMPTKQRRPLTAANEPKKKSNFYFDPLLCWVLGTYHCIFGDHTDGNLSGLLVMTI